MRGWRRSSETINQVFVVVVIVVIVVIVVVVVQLFIVLSFQSLLAAIVVSLALHFFG